MKRYNAVNFEYDDAYGTGTALDIVEHDEGEFVKFDDIKRLLQNTSSNSDYMSALKVIKEWVESKSILPLEAYICERLNQHR